MRPEPESFFEASPFQFQCRSLHGSGQLFGFLTRDQWSPTSGFRVDAHQGEYLGTQMKPQAMWRHLGIQGIKNGQGATTFPWPLILAVKQLCG